MKTQLNNYKTYLTGIQKSMVYYDILSPFITYLGENNIDFNTITKDQIAHYFTIKEYKARSINLLISAIKDFCKYLNIEKHQVNEIKLVRTDNKKGGYITYEELLSAIKHYATFNTRGVSTLKCNAILKFLFFTGMRKSEILILKRADIDLTNCVVKVYGVKTKEERLCYFVELILKDLVDYFNSEEEKENAFNISSTELWYLTKKISKQIGKKVTPHTLRHSFANYMWNKNLNPRILQRILGHASIETTMIYANPDDKTAHETYKKQVG